MKRKTGKTILIWVGLLFCTCSNLSNPFIINTDESRAEIFNWNLSDSLSIDIFSTYTIPVRVLLGQHLDSFKVSIDNNRLWGSQDSVVYRNEIKPGLIYSFPFSFYDTGWQKIKLISYRNDGKSVVDSRILRAVSPLKQNTISGAIGDYIQLNTLPVKDKQVLYVWDFHNGVVIKEYACSARVKITAPFTSRYGQLYVEDYSGHRSPVTLFEITSQSSQKELSLVCVNDSVRGDTVFSAEAQMKFRLEVSGIQQLKNASINGQNFDENQRKGDLFLLGYNLKGLDTATAPQKLDVAITDELGRSVSRTFYVKFIKVTPAIYVLYPENKLYTADSMLKVLGTVSNIRQNSILYLFIRNNGKKLTNTLVTSIQPDFSFEIPLSGFSNHISLELFSDSLMEGSMLANQDFYVYYDPSHIDTIAPQIRNIRCNGVLVDSLFTSRTDTMQIKIDAIDNSNKLTVTVNGKPVVKGANELFFSTEVVLTHKKEHTVIAIQAKDSAGYLVEDTIYVRYNRLPEWKEIPSNSAANAEADNLFKVSVVDPDGDPVLVTMTIPLKSADTVLNASSGQVSWKPQISDTGTYTIRLEASDEYERADTFFTVFVIGNDTTPVKLLTSKNDFPDTLWIGESLSVPLRAIPLTGTRPFKYRAHFIDSKPEIIHNGSDSVLHWIPKIKDTGLRKLRVEIVDSLNYTDSDTIEIMVLLATVRWKKNPVQCYEKDSVLITGAILSKPLNFPVKIGYRLSFPYDNGATDKDVDAQLSGVIEFKKGDTLSSLKIKVFDDSIPENTEKFNIEFIDNDSLRSDVSILECEIIDNDLVFFYLSENEVGLTEEDKTDTLIARISKPLDVRLVLSYLVDSKSTAKLGEDFTLKNNDWKVVFEPGETEALILLDILEDNLPETTEQIILQLKCDSSFAALQTDSIIYSIYDDDFISYSFVQSEMTGYEGDTVVKIAVKLSRKPKLPFTLKYSLNNDPSNTTAILNSDFRFMDTTGLLTFAADDSIEEISVLLIDDTIPKDNSFFTLDLHSVSEPAKQGDISSCKYSITPNEVEVHFTSSMQGATEKWHDEPYCRIMVSPPSNKQLDVYFRVVKSRSDADSGSDYTIQAPGFVRFMPGEDEKNPEVKIIDDDLPERKEKFVLEITGLSDKKIAYVGTDKRITIEIVSDE